MQATNGFALKRFFRKRDLARSHRGNFVSHPRLYFPAPSVLSGRGNPVFPSFCMNASESAPTSPPAATAALARVILFTFLLTFIATRVLVFLIMSHRMPDLYLHVRGTHVHHLNYGIFILSALAGYLLFKRPGGRALTVAGAIYGIGLALTFDEFGMWVRLGGAYWQRASLDAIGVLAALLGLIAFAPTWKRFRPRHWWSAAIILVAVAIFAFLLAESFQYARRVIAPRLQEMEATGPS
jgi:hypothetical protein